MDKLKVNYFEDLSYYKLSYFIKDYIDTNTVIICIGTDRCIGDCLGPAVGSMLVQKNFPLKVYGTINSPIHALNIDKKLKEIKKENPASKIIGIDACLGNKKNIGEIQARNYPIHPGKGVGKVLPAVGDYSIIGIVDSSDNNELFTNRNIRLNLILDMAKVICDAFLHSYYLFKFR
ncbi:spore protease YyaC [Clostridium sp. DL1XJH146]